MDSRDWNLEYQQIIDNSQGKAKANSSIKDHDKRGAPRFSIKTGTIWIKTEHSFEVVDISVSGIAFFSSFNFTVDQILAITLGKAFLIEGKVVTSSIVETDEIFLETGYRVSCTFLDENTGMRFLVMLKEMDELEIEIKIQD